MMHAHFNTRTLTHTHTHYIHTIDYLFKTVYTHIRTRRDKTSSQCTSVCVLAHPKFPTHRPTAVPATRWHWLKTFVIGLHSGRRQASLIIIIIITDAFLCVCVFIYVKIMTISILTCSAGHVPRTHIYATSERQISENK